MDILLIKYFRYVAVMLTEDILIFFPGISYELSA